MIPSERTPIFSAPDPDRKHENRAALLRVLEATRGAATPEELVRGVLESVRASFGWVYASYFAVERSDGAEPVLRFAFDSGEVHSTFREATHNVRFTRGVGLAGLAWQRGDFVFVEDVTGVEGFLRAEAARASGIRSGFWVPVISGGDVTGTVEYFSPVLMRPGRERMAALHAIQAIVSLALERMRFATRLANPGA